MARPLPVAMAQLGPLPIGASIATFADQVQAILQRFPETTLVVFPELHLFGAPDGPQQEQELRESSQPLDGPLVHDLLQLAGDLGVWLIPGSVCERGPEEELFNTALVLTPQGSLAASYRKVFVWRPYEPYDPGDRFVVFDMPGFGRLGLSICYDAWFPEVCRHLAWMGAEVVVNVAKTTTPDRDQEVILTRANAIANQVFVISVNCAGPVGTGRSLLVDPEGRERVHSDDADATILSDAIDLAAAELVRARGTLGLNRLWQPFRDGDSPLALPLYDGRIDPKTWEPWPRGQTQTPTFNPMEEER